MPATDVSGEQRAELVPPQPNRLVTDIDAALKQQVFDVPQVQRDSHADQHCVADYLGEELK